MDTIGDLITRIRNGYLARQHEVTAPYSRISEAMVRLLFHHGYLESVLVTEGKTRRGTPIKQLSMTLTYQNGQPAVTGVKRVSTLGHRQYARVKTLPRVLGGHGMAIVSTNKGVMTDRDARKQGLGGEILCTVW